MSTFSHPRDFPKRRVLLLGAVSILGTASLPRAVRAASPVTYIEAAEAVVNIISGVAGLFGDDGLRDAMKQILSGIEGVLAQQERIIKDLASLRLHVDEALFASWQAAYARRIVSYHQQLANYTADLDAARWRVSPRLRADLEALSRDATTTTLEIGQMDPWAFQSFGIGVSLVLTADKILGTSSQRSAETRKGFRDAIDRWLDQGNPRSLVSEQSRMDAFIAKLTSDLNARPRSWVTRHQRIDDGESWHDEDDIVTVNGTIESGFAGQQRTVKGEEHRRQYHDCRGSACKLSRVLSADSRLSSMAPKAGTPQATIIVPGFSASGWLIIDSFNKDRIAVYEAMAAKERQQILQMTMAEAKTALA